MAKLKKQTNTLDPFGKGRELIGFPLRRPIRHKGQLLGNLVIDFEQPAPGKKQTSYSENLARIQGSVFFELLLLAPFFASDIQLELTLREKYLSGTAKKIRAMLSYRYDNPLDPLVGHFLWAEKDILDLVRLDGITALRLPAALTEISRWFARPATLNTKLDELKNALIDFALDNPKEKIRFPKGRPKEELPRLIGKKAISEMYQDLTAFCGVLNKNWDGEYNQESKEDLKEVASLFEASSLEYSRNLQEATAKDPANESVKQRLARIRAYENEKSAFKYASDCLLNSPRLFRYFSIGQFEPYELALRLMEEMFDLGRSTLKKFIYPRIQDKSNARTAGVHTSPLDTKR